MNLPQYFLDDVASVCTNGAKTAEKLHLIAYKGVCKAYAGDMSYLQYVFDNVPKYMQSPLLSWTKSVGINVITPSAGKPRYAVQSVIDQAKQADKLKLAKSKPVMEVAHAVPKAKEPKPLAGTPKERALAAIAAVIKRKRETDDTCAAFLNEVFQLVANLETEVRDAE
jgi:hypothetical protein